MAICSPPLRTGSLGFPWEQESCAAARRRPAVLGAAVRPRLGAQGAVAVPAPDTARCGGAGRAAGAAAAQPLEGRREPPMPEPGAAGSAGSRARVRRARTLPAPPGCREHAAVLAGAQGALTQVLVSSSFPLLGWCCPETGLDGAKTCLLLLLPPRASVRSLPLSGLQPAEEDTEGRSPCGLQHPHERKQRCRY